MKQKQIILFLFFLLSCSAVVFGQNNNQPVRNTIINNGIGLGGAIAVAISWSRNKSILWAIIHGIFGWLYIIYYYLNRDRNET